MTCQQCGRPTFGPVCGVCKGELWPDKPAKVAESEDLAPVESLQSTLSWLKESSEEKGAILDPGEVYEAVVELLVEKNQMIKDLWRVVVKVPTTQTRVAHGTDRLEMRCLGCDKLVDKCRNSDSTCWAKEIVRLQTDLATEIPK